MKEYMDEAINEANKNAINNFKDGGPFGAVIEKDGKIIARAHNTVIESKDPTAHAEMNAIRMASSILGTNDLTGCSLYVNAEPCPMCLSAIIWSNIKYVYYANTAEESDAIGFRDKVIYDYIKENSSDTNIINMIHIENESAKKTFQDYKNGDEKIMY